MPIREKRIKLNKPALNAPPLARVYSKKELMESQNILMDVDPSFRRKPESSLFSYFQKHWTPFFNGVTTFFEFIKNCRSGKTGLSTFC